MRVNKSGKLQSEWEVFIEVLTPTWLAIYLKKRKVLKEWKWAFRNGIVTKEQFEHTKANISKM